MRRQIPSVTLLAACAGWLAFLLATVPWTASADGTNAAALQFVEPTNNAVYSTLDEVPIVLHASGPGDDFLSATILANQHIIGTASFCCSFCPCAHPQQGQETTLQIPVPRMGGVPQSRPWQGWTNIQAGSYRLTAWATGEVGTVVEAAPVNITVLDLQVRVAVEADGSVILTIPQGSMVPDGYYAESSADLRTWSRLGPFLPGNVAAFFYDYSPVPARAQRFYRTVYIPPRPQ